MHRVPTWIPLQNIMMHGTLWLLRFLLFCWSLHCWRSSCWTVPQLFESTRPMSLALSQNKNLSVLAYVEVFWWARVDSNHRSWKQQIYSLSPLATREHAHIHFLCPSPDDLFILSCRKAFVNCFFTFFFKCVFRAEKRREKPCSHAGTAKSEKKASRKKLIGKLQEKLGTICEKCKTFCLCIEKRSKAWYIKNATKCNKMDGAFVTLWQIRRDK